jgi:hypothetical protein
LVTTGEFATSKRALERKAVEYEKLRRGWNKDLTEEQRENILVDFDTKYAEVDDDDDEEDEFEEPLVEVVDEFGRTRMVKQTRMLRPPTPEQEFALYSVSLQC